jgi:DNA polymerase-3 subunit epsilon
MELATTVPMAVEPRAGITGPGGGAGMASVGSAAAAEPSGPGAVPDLALDEVPFAVVDVETTGGSPDDGALTEVAVAVIVGGRCVEVFNRLVHPGVPIPPFITALTGISAATVAGAPVAGTVLPELRRVLAGRVLVGHNLPFDVGFLDGALRAAGLPTLDHVQVDTLVLARRLVGARVANCRLATLADALALAHRPSHRALADVWATADLLHHLLLRVRAHGILRLPQLMAFAVGPDPCRPSMAVGERAHGGAGARGSHLPG